MFYSNIISNSTLKNLTCGFCKFEIFKTEWICNSTPEWYLFSWIKAGHVLVYIVYVEMYGNYTYSYA